MASIATLAVNMIAKTAAFERSMKRVHGETNKLNTSISRISRNIIAIGAGYISFRTLISGFKSATIEAMDFEKGMARISTMLNSNSMNLLPKYSNKIEQLAVKYGQSVDALQAGAYDILSAQIDAAHGMDVLEIATRSAIGGFTDAGIVTKVIIKQLKAYGYEADKATKVSDIMHASVKRGIMTFEDYASSIGNVLGLSAYLDVNLEAVGATIASMTRAGLNADVAFMSLNNIFAKFKNPTDEARKAAKELGFELNSTSIRGSGLINIIDKLRYANARQLDALMPSMRGVKGFAGALKNATGVMDDYEYIVHSSGLTQEQFNKAIDNASYRLDQAYESLKRTGKLYGESFKETKTKGLSLTDKALQGLYITLNKSAKGWANLYAAMWEMRAIIDRYPDVWLGYAEPAREAADKFQENIDKMVEVNRTGFERMEESVKKFEKTYKSIDFSGLPKSIFEVDMGFNIPELDFVNIEQISDKLEKVLKELEEYKNKLNYTFEDIGKNKWQKMISKINRMGDELEGPDLNRFNNQLSEMYDLIFKIKGKETELKYQKEETEKQHKLQETIQKTIGNLEKEVRVYKLVEDGKAKDIEQAKFQIELQKAWGEGTSEAIELQNRYAKAYDYIIKARDKEKRVVDETKRAIEAVRHLDYATRNERIQNLQDYVAAHKQMIEAIPEAEKLINEEIAALGRSRVNAMKLYNREMEDDFENMNLYMSEKFAGFTNSVESSLGSAFSTAFQGGENAWEDFMLSIRNAWFDMIGQMIARAVMLSTFKGIGMFLPGPTGSVKGNVFNSGKLVPMAAGGIINRPTIFPMASGYGLMGEAGPEAVVPLKRTSGGRLGIESAGGSQLPSVIIKFENKGTPQQEVSRNVRYDKILKQFVINLVTTDADRNGPMTQAIHANRRSIR